LIDRELLGQYVRMIEIELAYEQSVEEPSASETTSFPDLPEADKERRRRIGEFIANVLHKNHHPLDLYQQEVQRTVATKGYGDTLAMTSMGLAGETGECVELIKKHLWHSHELDKDKIQGEIGDVLWYISAMCNALNISLKDALDKNIEKLRRRYPDGFSAEASRNRERE
jgi:NTP pyrophosphatase (non-canonical NTP hydrolase)